MFKLLLSTYLSLAAGLGPALCCCTIGSFISELSNPNACDHGSCCHSHASTRSPSHEHHAPSSSRSLNGSERGAHSTSSEDDGDHCPCSEHRQTIAVYPASDEIGGSYLAAAQHVLLDWTFLALPLVPSEQDIASTLRLADDRPCSVYGREILRAYHKLQC